MRNFSLLIIGDYLGPCLKNAMVFEDDPVYELSIIPNPFTNQTKINLSLSQDENLIIRIYTIIGQLAAILNNSILTEGQHNFEWSGQDYTPGIYILKISSQYRNEAYKIYKN